MDVVALAQRLRAALKGEVRFDATSRALYATDSSNYRQVPIGVLLPRDREDVIAAMAICREFGAPVLPRGAGTSLCGQSCNVAVLFDLSKYMDRILDLDPVARSATVQPGVVLDDLREAAEEFQLTLAPDPSTHTHNTLGGMIGNNSCGAHSIMGGRMDENVLELEVLTYDGACFRVGATSAEELQEILERGGRQAEIYGALCALRDAHADEIRQRFPDIPRRVSGFNLSDLLEENGFNVARALVGSEGTCCLVLEAKVRLVHSPPQRVLLTLGCQDVYAAADLVPRVLRHGPTALEGMDDRLVDDMRTLDMHLEGIDKLPEGCGWLLVEFGGATEAEARDKAEALMEELQGLDQPLAMELFAEQEDRQHMWRVRDSGLGATAHVPHRDITWEGWEDSAVPPERLGDYLRELRELYRKHDYQGDIYGHFGQGCVHTRINFDLESRPGIEQYKRFMEDASDLVLRHGGSLSGEHGDGQSKAQFLGKMFGERLLEAFREFKTIWDPQWKMNPGKVVVPYQIDENLRLGHDYQPLAVDSWFSYRGDHGEFPRAALRCVGVGKCRKHDSGTMCPSYMATREEMHSTRGRARLLFEMLQGEVIRDGWRSEGLREALDLCLSCKGCLDECPVSVDMATYKAEFMAHHYQGRLRPRAAYAFGLIDRWLALAAWLPGVANFLARTAPFADLCKRIANIAPQRDIPELAPQTFRSWYRKRPQESGNGSRTRVLLWPDTFSNHLLPERAKSALNVLEAAGFQVVLPAKKLCCGRPLYENGMLDLARLRLEEILRCLRDELRAGLPIVVLEPSCASVFRNEACNLLPERADAKRLQEQTWFFAEFMRDHAAEFTLPPLQRQALVQGHCHHKAVMGMSADETLLDRLGLNYEVLDAGCCGMAGSFGFEKHKYSLSLAIAERALLPAVRAAHEETLIIADGFSCREQVVQCTGRRPLHLAEVADLALRQAKGEA